jgi:hypothetical protein
MRLIAILVILFLLSLVQGGYEHSRRKQHKDTHSTDYSLFDDDDFYFEDKAVNKVPKTKCRGSACKKVPKHEKKVEPEDSFEWEEESFFEVRPLPAPMPKSIPKIKKRPQPKPKPKRKPAPASLCNGPSCGSKCDGPRCHSVPRPIPIPSLCNGPTCRSRQRCNGSTCRSNQHCNGPSCGRIPRCNGPTCRGNQRPPLRPQPRPVPTPLQAPGQNQRRRSTNIPVADNTIDPSFDDYDNYDDNVDPSYDDYVDPATGEYIDSSGNDYMDLIYNAAYNPANSDVFQTGTTNGNYWTSYEQEDNTYVTANRYEPKNVART